jgi:WhiB family redox-sensing transcriptional regulator
MSYYSGSIPDLDRADDWRDFAACRLEDPEVFFAEGKASRAEVIHAQAVCHGCPVRKQCGEYAIEAGENWGVWGGMNQNQLRQHRRRFSTGDAA